MAIRILVNNYYTELITESCDATALSNLSQHILIHRAPRKQNVYRSSNTFLPEILQILRGINDSSSLNGLAKEVYDSEILRRSRVPEIKQNGTTLVSKFLWPHQLMGVEIAKYADRYNFFYDTRTGKTLMSLQIIYDKLSSGEIKRALILCPATIIKSWLGDAATHFPMLKVASYYGTEAQKKKALETPCHIFICSTESVINNIDLLKRISVDLCILDESSKAKSYKSKVSQALLDLSLTIKYWYNLSATPAPNGHEEYYIQMLLVDPACFSQVRTNFLDTYFDNVSRSPQYRKNVIKPNMLKPFMDIVEKHSIYVDQSVMPTKGKEWHVVKYKLGDAAMQYYNDMKKSMAMQVNDEKLITVDMAAGMRNKLSQIASGFIIDTAARQQNKVNKLLGVDELEQDTYILGDTSRIETLKKLLDKLGNEKVVIWANYEQQFKDIENLLGSNNVRCLRGGSTIQYKEESIDAFKRGSLQYLVCHPLSVGMGINLTESCNAIYYAMTDSWEALKQSSERIRGHITVQTRDVHYWVIQAENTVDELIYDNVTNKREASVGFLNHLRGE